MNNAINTKQTLLEIGFFRITLGLYLLLYNLPFWPKLHLIYGNGSMIPDGYLPGYLMQAPSFFPWPTIWFSSLFALMLIFIVLFTLGLLNKTTLIPLYILQVYFYHANPLIIHEPQPLANLFLFLFFFLPPNSAPTVLPQGGFRFSAANTAELKILLKIIIAFFGIYYFFVGLKKLPDPLWRQGLALQFILEWDGAARQNGLTALITGSPLLSRIMSYGTLVFEMSFILLVFTPLRLLCIVGGLVLHGGILLTMDVGTLSLALMVWYALLFDKRTREQLSRIFKR